MTNSRKFVCFQDHLKESFFANDWRIDEEYDAALVFVRHPSSEAVQYCRVWELGELEDRTSTTGRMQCEIYVRLKRLEDWIDENLKPEWKNEFNKTCGSFLNQLVPRALRQSMGVPVLLNEPLRKQATEFFSTIDTYSRDFYSGVASGEWLLSGGNVTPLMVDPLKWEVRRFVWTLMTGLVTTEAGAHSEAQVTRTRLEIGLTEKYNRMASVSRIIHAPSKIVHALATFDDFIVENLTNPTGKLKAYLTSDPCGQR